MRDKSSQSERVVRKAEKAEKPKKHSQRERADGKRGKTHINTKTQILVVVFLSVQKGARFDPRRAGARMTLTDPDAGRACAPRLPRLPNLHQASRSSRTFSRTRLARRLMLSFRRGRLRVDRHIVAPCLASFSSFSTFPCV